MLPNDQNSKLAIYVAEKLEKDTCDIITEWYHSFLVLVDETTSPVTILQQLHFDADASNFYSLLPFAMEGTSDPKKLGKRFDGVLVFPVIGGKCKDIVNMWNDALEYSLDLKHKKIPFDQENYKFSENSINCRAGVIAALDSIGVNYARGYYVSDAGTKCDQIPLNQSFSSALNGDCLETILGRNKHLMNALGSHLYKNRYVGPVGGTLYVISP